MFIKNLASHFHIVYKRMVSQNISWRRGAFMFNKNLISILDITTIQQQKVFELACQEQALFKNFHNALEDKVLGSIFFQPSTRTQFSFQSAFVRLGGEYIGCADIGQTRSGPPYYEPLCDMGKIISNYCDVIVMRTIDDLQTIQLAEGTHVPLISAGSGNVEHPTQALTDLYTIKSIYGALTGYDILIIGTPRQRTINSLIKGLSAWGENHFHILCQSGVELSEKVYQNLGSSSVKYYHNWGEIFDSGIANSISIIYIDKFFYETHRHNQFVPDESEFKSHFSKGTIILHPLPRTSELPNFIDDLPGASYFKQAKNGLYVRAALFLYYLLDYIT